MPRIAAASVREHRAQMQAKLIDAAERILQSGGTLTAGEVASSAGIARNSLYRYVESVDDLRILVLNRHLPEWGGLMADALAGVDTPRDKAIAYVEATLREAAPGGAAWVMRMAHSIASGSAPGGPAEVPDVLREQVEAAGVRDVDLVVRIVEGILHAGFERLDAGDEPAEVVAGCCGAAAAVLDAAQRR